MTRFRVDLDELDRVVAGLDGFAKALSAGLAELDQVIDTVHQDWVGEAARAQTLAHHKLAVAAREMHTALLGLHAAGRHAHGSYQGAVHANTQTWKQVR
ncbi:MAG: WXG100 family type VII secretion target [Acidimicrobiaceae bacterium]|nr:WXG100 family type VII secretion target [Acidimicrobiaceae bacterium]